MPWSKTEYFRDYYLHNKQHYIERYQRQKKEKRNEVNDKIYYYKNINKKKRLLE